MRPEGTLASVPSMKAYPPWVVGYQHQLQLGWHKLNQANFSFVSFHPCLFGLWTYIVHMKVATLRELRNEFSTLQVWLEEGETIRIEKRGTPVAFLTPAESPPSTLPSHRPDAAARRKAIWGDRCFSEEEVKAMRDYELEGEEG